MLDHARRTVVAVAGMLVFLAISRDAAAGCPRGQHQAGRKCVEVSVPPNAELTFLGDGWQCLRGYRRSGDQCKRSPSGTAPEIADSPGNPPRGTWPAQSGGATRVAPQLAPSVRSCCKVCSRGCPCGNSCISCAKTCHKGPGCAC